MARFIESWSQLTLHPALVRIILMDIHDSLAPVDQAFPAPPANPASG